MRSIRVLSFDKLVGGSEEEVGVAESLHHEERLRVAGHALVCQPDAERLLIVKALLLDAPVPRVYVLAGSLLEETSGHVSHSFPVTNSRHRNLHSFAERCKVHVERDPERVYQRDPPHQTICRTRQCLFPSPLARENIPPPSAA